MAFLDELKESSVGFIKGVGGLCETGNSRDGTNDERDIRAMKSPGSSCVKEHTYFNF